MRVCKSKLSFLVWVFLCPRKHGCDYLHLVAAVCVLSLNHFFLHPRRFQPSFPFSSITLIALSCPSLPRSYRSFSPLHSLRNGLSSVAGVINGTLLRAPWHSQHRSAHQKAVMVSWTRPTVMQHVWLGWCTIANSTKAAIQITLDVIYAFQRVQRTDVGKGGFMSDHTQSVLFVSLTRWFTGFLWSSGDVILG